MTHYILQVIVCQLLFLAVYDLFLKKETFFNLNRAYLLFTPLLSIVIPLAEISIIRESVPEVYHFQLPEIIIGATKTPETTTTGFPYMTLVWVLGVLGSLLLFGRKWLRYLQLKRKGTVVKSNEFTLIELPNTTIAFSFFRNIFLGRDLTEKQRKSILRHEQVHVKERHTWDLMWFELLRVIFWFNPLMYVYQKRITTLQEYIADQKAMTFGGKKDYYESLLSSVFQTESISFINTFFNHSLIKKRIVMLQKSRSSKILQLKYLLLLPVVGLMMFYSSCAQEDPKASETSSTERIAELKKALDQGEITQAETKELKELMAQEYAGKPKGKGLGSDVESDAIPFAVLTEPPIYPGCEGLTGKEAQQCFNQKVAQFVMENFDRDIPKDSDIEGAQRIVVQFKINKEGVITDVRSRAPHPILEKMAYSSVSKLPVMQPGKKDGKPVTVVYSLPIIFKLQ
ncbi:M56 family metallopeptidase [Aureisphaera galaxeae]|uniref:M56 family metallopeptidase n=1 Tax=Aureisphaera galaxeae TaxID=1538023 RepID=UPI002350B7E1|nr:M56 family metallopeptidase [Aureisphaera galaxeae]MDC8002856.1 M56 family metallopeptidase [Aureisphaera galaxeae]